MMDCFTRQQDAESACNSTKFTFEQLTRLLLKASIDFCGLDLFNNEVPRLSELPANTTTPAPRGDEKRRPRWALFARGLYFYTATRILVYICLQYMYDFDWYAHESLRKSGLQFTSTTIATAATTTNNREASSIASGPSNTAANDTSDDQLQLLGQRIERDIRRLKLFGAPLMRLHFASELLYIYVTWAVFVMYFRSQLYFRHIKPFDVSLLRSLVDWEREQLNCDKMVRNEVNKFCLSNKFFVESQLHWSAAGHSRFAGPKANQLLANFGRTAEQLNQMAADGSLRPFNRSSEWIKHTHRRVGRFGLLNVFCLSSLIVVLFAFLPQSKVLDKIKIETAPMDLVFILDTLIFSVFDVVSCNFYLTAVVVNTLDQIRMVDELNKLIERCICYNTNTLEQIQAGGGGRFSSLSADCPASLVDSTDMEAGALTRPALAQSTTMSNQDDDEGKATARETIDQFVDQMNSNLLFVVMSYKIFVSQAKASRHFTAYILFTIAELMVLLPATSLISSQYLTTSMLYVAVVSSLSLIILGDICLAPCCHVHSCHLRTYRSLHSLLAHTVEVGRAAASTVDLYDSHTILILRKELDEPELLLQQFAIKLLGINFSYRNSLRIHFWCGILGILGYYVTSGPSKGGILEKTIKFF